MAGTRIDDVINLSNLLGEMGSIMRATKLPSGDDESDSHHSFSLALIAYHIVRSDCPELDADKVLRFALVHDLLEVVTGDEDTLHYTAQQHAQKQKREELAMEQFGALFSAYPFLTDALHEYERLDTPEAVTVFMLDKACTTWTHHADGGAYARSARNITTKAHADAWAERQREKLRQRIKAEPPQPILDIWETSFQRLRDLFDD